MASNRIRLAGVAKWVRLIDPDPKYDHWSLNLYLDKESQAVFDASGLKLKVKNDDDGMFIGLRRKPVQTIKGEEVQVDPPKVITADGREMDADEIRSIGNGSEVVCTVEVYETKKYGMGHRLEAVRVTKHEVYEPKSKEIF